MLAFCALASCGGYGRSKMEKAVENHMKVVLHKPETFRATRYYEPQRLEITADDVEAIKAINPEATPFNGWQVAVDMEAVDTNGNKSTQAANFWLNVDGDSVLYSDVAGHFRKKER